MVAAPEIPEFRGETREHSTHAGAGCVYLVGAGPGDPELLTLRAFKLLQSADVVAHDKLVSREILSLIPEQSERLDVGRCCGCGPPQPALHPAILARAKAGFGIVRLKAGDPFVFGRGGEEAQALAKAGIPFEVVPGITSALGAAASTGIPLTHRECASNVVFASGHDAEGQPSGLTDWEHLAKTEGTIVLFMVGRRLGANLSRLIMSGRNSGTPAAYVVAATTPRQQVVKGTLGDLADRCVNVDTGEPALLIVGEVVSVLGGIPALSSATRLSGGSICSSKDRFKKVVSS